MTIFRTYAGVVLLVPQADIFAGNLASLQSLDVSQLTASPQAVSFTRRMFVNFLRTPGTRGGVWKRELIHVPAYI